MALLPQDTFADDCVTTAPSHSRLPRLDLGIDWVPRWEEFRTSLSGALTGPRPNGNEAVSGGEDLRVEWVRGYRPRSPLLVAALCHAVAIWLITLPIWGFLPQTQAAVPMQLNVQWDLSELPAISLPARTAKKNVARTRTDDAPTKNPQRGADAYNPRQTILSTPVRLTHPRQTLIEPDAPSKAPTIIQQLPNIVQWSAPQLQRPPIEYSASQSKPKLREARRRSAAAPQIAENAKAETLDLADTREIRVAVPAPVVSKAVIAPRRTLRRAAVAPPQLGDTEKNTSLSNVAETNDVRLAPPAPVPSDSAVMARRRTVRGAAAAPEIAEQTNGNPADVRKLVALSAAPAPPAPEVQIPRGNLAASVAISPDGKKRGTPGEVEHGAADSVAASANGDSLPAAISVSGLSGKAANGNGSARPGNITPHLNLSTRPMIYPGSETSHAERTGPANVAALPPGAPPEEILSGKVFSMHVSTPNTTSTLGSWTLSFAQLGDDSGVAAGPNHELSGPEPIYTVDPKYPPDTMLEHITGEVVLYAIIRKDGSVDSIQLVQSLDPRLDRAAMDALAQWKFRPGSRGGRPVDLEAVIHVPFEYRRLKY